MRRSTVWLVLTTSMILFLATAYVQYSSGYVRVAVMGPFSSSRFLSHRNTYREALHMYMEDHPHSRLKILEVDISYQATPEIISEKVSYIHSKGVRFIVAPYSSPLTDAISKEAEKYGMVVFAPFSRYTQSRENLIVMTPSFSDFAKVAVDFVRSGNFKRVTILGNFRYTVDRKMAEELKEDFSILGLKTVLKENLESSDLDPSNLIVVLKNFPVFFARDLAMIRNADVRPTVLLVSTYIDLFESFYGRYMDGIYAIDHTFYYTDMGRRIVESYRKRFGRVPSPGVVAMYDTLSLMERILREGKDVTASHVRSLGFYRGFMGDIPLDGKDMTDLLTIVVFKEKDGRLVKIRVRE